MCLGRGDMSSRPRPSIGPQESTNAILGGFLIIIIV